MCYVSVILIHGGDSSDFSGHSGLLNGYCVRSLLSLVVDQSALCDYARTDISLCISSSDMAEPNPPQEKEGA